MALSCVSENVDGPAILRLQKWGPSEAQINLSEFREAFISPTRELLLLLSYQCEALLIPLISGEDSMNRDDLGTCYSENYQDSGSLNFSSSALAASSRSDSLDDIPCTSETVEDVSDSAFSFKSRSSRSKHYPVLSDVNSLAWGHCGDAYDQHKRAAFRELLFVSDNHDITVHAFRYLEKTNEMTKPLPECMDGRGRWEEWGPSTSSVHNTQATEKPSSCQVNGTIETEQNSNYVSGVVSNNESSISRSTSKKWLCTFFTEVETIESGGKIWTKFPAMSSFPCSAEVVSFSISNSISVFLDFLSRSNTTSYKKQHQGEATGLQDSARGTLDSNSSLLDQVVNSDSASNILSPETTSLFKCLRVFSSSSSRLIGFVLTLEDPLLINNSEENTRSLSKVVVVVTMVYQWGIEWVTSLKLHDASLSQGPEFEWTDFQFSDNLVLCLNASGLIFVYGATTGELVERLDVLQICGLNPKQKLSRQAEMSVESDLSPRNADIQTERDDKIHGTSTFQIEGYLCANRSFKRLMVASSSSLLAAVDECGVIYLIYPGDYTSEKIHSFNKLHAQYGHSLIDVFVRWEVGGSEIGHQRNLNKLSMNTDNFPHIVNNGDTKPLKKQNCYLQGNGGQYSSCLSGFSAASQIKDQGIPSSILSLNPMRRIFLPRDGSSKNDSICFSPLGITRLSKKWDVNEGKCFKIVHTHLRVASTIHDDEGVGSLYPTCGSLDREGAFIGEALGCCFQGCLYLVTKDGLSVVLPSVSVTSTDAPVESICYWRPSTFTGTEDQNENLLVTKKSKEHWPPWKMEVLDRVLLYEGPEEADLICLENGWDLKIARLRRLQLALDYLKPDEIEQSLEMLVDVNLAEEGILRLLFTAVYQIFCRAGNDNEVALASRLLALAASFATKMVRKYGLLQHKKDEFRFQRVSDRDLNQINNSRRLHEMAHFLEVTRNLQCRLSANYRKPGQGLVDGRDVLSLADKNSLQDDSHPQFLNLDVVPLALQNQLELALPATELAFDGTEKLALTPMEPFETSTHLDSGTFNAMSVLASQGEVQGRILIPLEKPKDMIARWKIDNLDLKTIVKDALHSGRLPLAVLQLHLQHFKDLVTEKEPHDTFNEVRDVARAIAYDLLLKGETALAVATLQRLGEDIEISLKQLLFGTVRRSLRMQIAEELKRYGFLGPYEWKMLERISLIERLYPSSSFWRTFHGRQKEFGEATSSLSLPENKLQLTCLLSLDNCIIECGEIDGVVTGPWASISESCAFPVVDEETNHAGYWAGAAIWSDAWDQRTIDRIVLDQPFLMGVHVLWESQLEYHICHNDWEEVRKLLDMIPSSVLSNESLQINLDDLQSAETDGNYMGFSHNDKYICSPEELDVVCMTVPNVKVLKFSASNMCSVWLKMLFEQELAKRSIFLKEYWDGTAEIIPILARAGFIIKTSKSSVQDESIKSLPDLGFSNIGGEFDRDAAQAFHKLVIHHCAQYDLPNLLDLYLDHHKLVLDNDSLSSLQEAAGDCEWAKWLLLSRIKGREYDASLSNARAIISKNVVLGSKLSVLDMDEVIRTVDDIAEGGGELAALATLMYAPSPIQKCLFSGSVNRHFNSSAQCTLENLRPALQRFPTLWRTLIAACFGHDANGISLVPDAKSVFGNSALSDYLNWRESVFSSAGHDTSLVQMLPCWFSKAIRRLIQLFVQGPFGWQSLAGVPTGESFLHRDINFFINAHENAEVSAMSWEAAIQKSVEKELFGSSLEETAFGVEHHLHRGRALAAFNHLLGLRVQMLKSENGHRKESGASVPGQTNIQSDVQMLIAPVTQTEKSLLSTVMPLAISHFEDSVLVASCAFLLELCGLSASMLRVDVAALRRISSFYKSSEYNEHFQHLSPKGSAFHAVPHEGDITVSLARALADDYLHHDNASTVEQEETPNRVVASKQPSRAVLAVLQHLEKASLPLMVDGRTCGSWLLSGSGNGTEFRSQQKAASQHWSLVTAFCQMHQIPLSTKYLAVLAKDNDWVGFLTEAQVVGYPFDATIEVASKEFTDPRLKIHILTVLKSMFSTRKKSSSSSKSAPRGKNNEIEFSTESNVMVPVELFGLLAECEKQKSPGEALLLRAKDLRWSLLAMIASCFSDVSPLSCLTVWLEITAARETSSIKVNDIASQIANNVGAAVEATNLLPGSSRDLTFRYNRRSAKRRCLMEPATAATPSNLSCNPGVVRISVPSEFSPDEERRKLDDEDIKVLSDPDEGLASLSKMVSVLCEQRLFLPLLRAFEMFLPSCSLLPFIRSLQAFSQMRLSEASAHLASFSARIKEEPFHIKTNMGKEGQIGASWISSTAVRAADAMLSTCPSAYEKRCLLQLLAATDFGDGGSAATCFRRLYWKINLAEPSLRKEDDLYLGNETLDDASLLTALENNGNWEQARNWARQLEACGAPWKSAAHHVTETQAEAMVAEWKEFLWDVPEERAALWGHCQTLFLRYSFPALQAGLFFLKHAEAVEKDIPARELHEMLLLALQWLSGTITQSSPVYPLHLLREIETRVWLLAVESEAQVKCEGDFTSPISGLNLISGNSSSMIERTASIITKMDNHLNAMRFRATERNDMRESNQTYVRNSQALDASPPAAIGGTKTKRRPKSYLPSRKSLMDSVEKNSDPDDGSSSPSNSRNNTELFKGLPLQEENVKIEPSVSKWEERVGQEELERAVLSLLEFGQVAAAQQLQHKLSPSHVPAEFLLVDAALKVATISTPSCSEVSTSMLDAEVLSVIQSYNVLGDNNVFDPMQVLESLATKCTKDGGGGLCKRIIAVVKAANVLGLSFSEAFGKRPLELLQLLSLKAQDSLEEAKLLVQTHSMPPASIAQILAESFLKGLLAAHRGGYMDSQKEEGPAPLLWRLSDFLKWAELCPSEPEVGHALMRLVITGQEIPHACEVELLILSHHFYKSSACLDGVDVLVALAATRVESYVSEGDFSCLARLVTGVSNFHALNFILGILIENGQLDLLLQKYSSADTTTGTAESVRGFRLAVLTSLKLFNPHDLDAFAMVYNHFNMKHETASLLESQAMQSIRQWFLRYDKEQTEDLLESMRYFIEAAQVYSTIDAGNKTRNSCAQASLLSLQIRMPDFYWLNLSETNARRALVEQSRFQEALIVAEAYRLNQPGEWALVLWNQMLKPELTEQFVAEFVAVLPLQPSMLVELARFYRAEVAARGDQSHFSVWLSPGGLPAEWLKHLGRSFRSLLRRTRDLRLRVQLATTATGFSDVIEACAKALDKVPETAGPLVLRRGHGGTYLPLM
ncbi:Spatacsin [Macleaya cordata]|uniref:Spatacsin n=1 Tax=Macleaya cordata TaxID=56857 RepID=A0A200QCB8_MACCD|nr:Spatacsin [Macleaya cordata]